MQKANTGVLDTSVASGARAALVFGGIDTLADVFLNGEKIGDIATVIAADALKAGVKIKKGKKVFHKAIIA